MVIYEAGPWNSAAIQEIAVHDSGQERRQDRAVTGWKENNLSERAAPAPPLKMAP